MQRPLGVNEHLWYRLGELDSNNFVMVAQLKGRVDQAKLEMSLRRLIGAHDILRAHIKYEGRKKFLSVGEIKDLALTIIQRDSEDQWLERSEHELNDAIDGDAKSLWRLIWLKGEAASELIVTFNHLLGDGRTGQLFFDYLLRSLSDTSYEIPKRSLPVNFEKQLKKSGKVLSRWKQGSQSLKRFLKEGKRDWRKISAAQLSEAKACTRIISRRLKQAQVTQLMQWSRTEKTSVTAVLAASLAQVLDEDLAPGEALGISVAIDTRPQCEPSSATALGYFVSTANLVMSQKESLGDLSCQFKADLDEQNSPVQMKFDACYRSLALRITKDKKSFKKLVQSKTSNAALLTNLGKLDLETHYGEFELIHCFHIPAVHLLDAAYLSLATTTCRGEMQLSFTYPGHLMTETQVGTWADKLIDLLSLNQ